MNKKRYTIQQLKRALGVVCKQQRTENGWSIRDAERITGIRKSALSKIEHGTANPCLRTLEKLMDAYGSELIRTAEWLAYTYAPKSEVGHE